MANRKTGLDFSVWSVGGTALIGNVVNFKVDIENATAEGKGVADIDAWPVLTGRKTSGSGQLIIDSAGTVYLAALATSNTPAGSVLVTTGAGGGYTGTAVITKHTWTGARDELQTVDITLEFRGAVPFA